MRDLAADGSNSDVRHRRIGFSAMPVALAGFGMHDIANADLTLFFLCRDPAAAGCDDQDPPRRPGAAPTLTSDPLPWRARAQRKVAL